MSTRTEISEISWICLQYFVVKVVMEEYPNLLLWSNNFIVLSQTTAIHLEYLSHNNKSGILINVSVIIIRESFPVTFDTRWFFFHCPLPVLPSLNTIFNNASDMRWSWWNEDTYYMRLKLCKWFYLLKC
jgi:hypothetical protein